MMRRAAILLAGIALIVGAADAQQLRLWSDTISPEAKAALAAEATRPPAGPTPEAQRAPIDAVQRDLGGRRLARYRVTMKEDVVAGVPVRIFSPPGKAKEGAVLMNLHGGGFVTDAGSITENVAIAALTGYRVVAVRYRLAPEHPFPAALDDALAVYRALLKQGRIGLYGTSAGAILSAELVARLRAEHLPQPAALGFFSGSADLGAMGDSVSLFADPAALAAVTSAYLGGTDPAAPALSPARGDLKGWPATLCVASTRDFLLSATAAFCRKLDAAGVDARLVVFDGLPHAFWAYIDAPESDEAMAAMARFLSARLEGGK
ncbi:alpha/beta hydrolase [Sphingomonas sp. CL5.1]|uniref:alpha/beta hydrolase n=1 Tax=Sphingomonas sp. CL5.1 TaxID=2653203 RepID=UPI0015842E53|nr:alpha/beta hydrolase fold domain-containing protein [Sphingomonas sp. CL5.1]QKS00083.1 alpha/beta hydrolase [Sphingomonas sp. CL5.1]